MNKISIDMGAIAKSAAITNRVFSATSRILQKLLKAKLSLAGGGFFGLAFASSFSIAGVMYDDVYDYTQPNGEVISIVLEGNSYYAEQRTLDGRLLIRCEKIAGMCYAKFSDDRQSLESSEELASNAAADESFSTQSLRQEEKVPAAVKKSIIKKTFKATHGHTPSSNRAEARLGAYAMDRQAETAAAVDGSVKGLILLIEFPEESGTISRSDVNNYANQRGYRGFDNAHSIRDYFLTASSKRLDYTNVVSAYVPARQSKAHYNARPYGTGAREMIRAALEDLNNRGYDFSQLTTQNGRVQALNVMYAGNHNTTWAKGLWPHAGGGVDFCADGVCFNRYQISPMNNRLSVGTFIHETGHLVLGWPDLYDYDGSSNGSVARFGVMGSGAFGNRPALPVGVLRTFAGWTQVTELNPQIESGAPQGALSLESNGNTLYRWSNPARRTNEAFYIEALHRSGQNANIPDSGLAVWHFDASGDNKNEDKPYIQMEHADGRRDPENKRNSGDQDDLYSSISGSAFARNSPNATAATNRGTNSRWSNNTDSGLIISGVSAASSSTMTFNVGTGDTAELATLSSPTAGSTLSGSSQTFRWNRPQGVQRFDMYVGTSGPGSKEIRGVDILNQTSLVVEGLPLDGSTIYVRLWTDTNGWQYRDYTFSAASPSETAELTSPAGGSTLSGTTQTFSWSQPPGVTYFDMYVGTSGPGSTDIRGESVTRETSLTLDNLPLDGSTIYLRLWSSNNGWKYRDYTFTAASGAARRIVSQQSNLCIDIAAGATENSANASQWRCHDGGNQKFEVVDIGNGYVELVAEHSGKCLNVAGNSRQDGANVLQWTCRNKRGNAFANSSFSLDDQGEGWFRLIARHSEKCLDIQGRSTESGANLQQWNCHNGLNQLFKFD